MKRYKNILDSKSILKLIFLVTVVIVSLFFANNDISYMFYIRTNPIGMYILIFSIAMFSCFCYRSFYIDVITGILFLRLLVYVIPIIYTEDISNYWGNYFSVISSYIAYFIASQRQNNIANHITKSINKILVFYCVLLSAQVIYLYYYLLHQYGYLSTNLLKYYMVTPIGGSNYIACIILPMLVFVYASSIKKYVKYFTIIVGVVALFMIQSKNALFVLFALISVNLIIKYIKVVRKTTKSPDIKRFILVISMLVSILIGATVFLLTKHFLNAWNMGMSYNDGSLYDVINAITSNRLNIYLHEIKRWTEHIFWGNGLAYAIGEKRSHNWIIDLLVQSGIVGFSLYLGAIFFWFIKVYKYKKINSLVKSSYCSIIVILIQGLAEVSLFTITVDIFMWYIIGLSISEINYLKKSKTA